VRHDPVHGKMGTLEHDGRTLFSGLPNPLTAGRYHSLVVDPDLPACLELSATGRQDGVVMAIRHRDLPAEGVQFHPESILTAEGPRLLGNFLEALPTGSTRVSSS
jgi:anthranilate synthase/aminodeoxychorismate synthase-like glutamine amidotransferase